MWITMKRATIEQAKDTGLAAVLILLFVAYLREDLRFVPAAMAVLVLTMVWPALFRPAARLWFGLSHLLGTVVSKILLSVVFFGVATPIGLVRRALGADSMKRREWKRGRGSVFVMRDDLCTERDLDRPF